MKLLISILTILTMGLACGSSAQDIEAERKELGRQFVLALRSDSLTNAEIISKFTVPWRYFKVDSVRSMADQWIDQVRERYRPFAVDSIEVYKYTEIAGELMVPDNPPGRPLNPPVKQMLSFGLDSEQGMKLPVDIENIYVVVARGNNPSTTFLLFDDENRIISFSAISFNSKVGMWQW